MSYGGQIVQPPYVTAAKSDKKSPRYKFTDNWEAMRIWLNVCPSIAARYKYILEFKAPGILIETSNSQDRLGSGSVKLQKIEDATGDHVNIDYYCIEFKITNPKSDLDAILNIFRAGLNVGLRANVWSKDKRVFIPHGKSEEDIWSSENPLGAIVDIVPGWVGPVFDDMTVLVGDFCSQKSIGSYWIFSTVWSSWNNFHPVSGNRLFGLERISLNDNKFKFYASGVDGSTHGPRIAFELGDQFWRDFFTNFERGFQISDPGAQFKAPIRATAKKADLGKLLKSDIFGT